MKSLLVNVSKNVHVHRMMIHMLDDTQTHTIFQTTNFEEREMARD